jgi:hypothetical protein
MAEYIDREKILKYIEENNTADEWILGQYNADWIYSFIESQPTADVVEVVRCKDCKYSIGEHPFLSEKLCIFHEVSVPVNYYCASGERRTDNDL